MANISKIKLPDGNTYNIAAYADEAGNSIRSAYGASVIASGNTVSLKNIQGTVISTATLSSVTDVTSDNTSTGVTVSVSTPAAGARAVKVDHNTSGVTAGTYDTVTVDAYGHATSGSNTLGFLTAGTDYKDSLSTSLSANSFYSMKTITYPAGTYMINGYALVATSSAAAGIQELGIYNSSNVRQDYNLYDCKYIPAITNSTSLQFQGIKEFTTQTTVYFKIRCSKASSLKEWSIQSFRLK